MRQKVGKSILFVMILLCFGGGLFAQVYFPGGDFWSLDAGAGISSILVAGQSFQFIIDPKLWLTPAFMVGSKLGVNYARESNRDRLEADYVYSDIVTFETQVYFRWNFLRLGSPGADNNRNTINFFAQAGLGIIAAYRGDVEPWDNVTKTRGSILADAALGATIPFGNRWHIEPEIRGGYPHIFGVSLTAGYKFPLPEKTKYIEGPSRLIYWNQAASVTPGVYVESISAVPSTALASLPPERAPAAAPVQAGTAPAQAGAGSQGAAQAGTPEAAAGVSSAAASSAATAPSSANAPRTPATDAPVMEAASTRPAAEPQPQIIYRDVVRTLPPNEIIKRIMITSIEFIIFGPDIGRYNIGVDHDAQGLNDLVLNETALFLKNNPDCRVRIEGNANPVTSDPRESDELMALSAMRAHAVAAQLREKGVTDAQMVTIAYGGTRTVTSDHDNWNQNRRVELIILQIDPNAN